MRYVRAAWPVLFLVPLSWWADRGCRFAGVDPLYHTTVWIHERLGWFVAALVALSAITVLCKLLRAQRRLARLLAFAETLPERERRAFERAGTELQITLPRIAYLDVSERIAATVSGPVILISRGFSAALDDEELTLVARHELVHASEGHARAGVLWHLAFASLLLPGFEPLERRLHAGRERRANVRAARDREDRYLAVLAREARGTRLCAGGGIGLEAAARGPRDAWLMWLSPALIVVLIVALPLSHMEFMRDLPFLLKHHC